MKHSNPATWAARRRPPRWTPSDNCSDAGNRGCWWWVGRISHRRDYDPDLRPADVLAGLQIQPARCRRDDGEFLAAQSRDAGAGGLFSDWLRVRKPLSLLLGVATLGMLHLVVPQFLSAALAEFAGIRYPAARRNYRVGLHPLVRVLLGVSRRPLAGSAGHRMVVLPDGLPLWIVVSGLLLLRVAAYYGWQVWMWSDGRGAVRCSWCRCWRCAAIGGQRRRSQSGEAAHGAPAHAAGGR